MKHLAKDRHAQPSAGRAPGAEPARAGARARDPPSPPIRDAGRHGRRRPQRPPSRGCAAAVPRAAPPTRGGAVLLDRSPELVDTVAAQRLGEDDRRFRRVHRAEREHLPDVGSPSLGRAGGRDLLTAITSGISMIPAFSACTESPDPGCSASTIVSAIESTPTSLWPMPTVSRKTTSFAGRVEQEQRLKRRLGEPARRGRACPSSG